jgi:hypothetical protein
MRAAWAPGCCAYPNHENPIKPPGWACSCAHGRLNGVGMREPAAYAGALTLRPSARAWRGCGLCVGSSTGRGTHLPPLLHATAATPRTAPAWYRMVGSAKQRLSSLPRLTGRPPPHGNSLSTTPLRSLLCTTPPQRPPYPCACTAPRQIGEMLSHATVISAVAQCSDPAMVPDLKAAVPPLITVVAIEGGVKR